MTCIENPEVWPPSVRNRLRSGSIFLGKTVLFLFFVLTVFSSLLTLPEIILLDSNKMAEAA